jgi:predicted nucleic acid-binding protein
MLLDAGPLFAFYSQSDRWHDWAAHQLANLTDPLYTCEAALTEASYLLQRQGGYPGTFLPLLQKGIVKIGIDIETEAAALNTLMHRYRNVPMSLADACLVRMSEIFKDSCVLTLDSDFRVYRRFGRQVVPLIIPSDR